MVQQQLVNGTQTPATNQQRKPVNKGTSQDQALRLGECDVAAICQGGDAQAAAVAHILVVVLYLCITDVDLAAPGLLVHEVPAFISA
eukprot:scaffold38437_cov20-Tisochrysis_lutea.AAC.10